MQAIVNEEGVRRFCEIATGNLDSLNDEQWRVLLETMKVKIFVNDSGITVKLAVPSTKEATSVIAANTSRCLSSGSGWIYRMSRLDICTIIHLLKKKPS